MLNATRVQMDALRSPSLGAPGHVTAILRPKIGKKWTGLNQYITVSTDVAGKRFVVFEHTINHLSSGGVSLFHLAYHFSFSSFFIFPRRYTFKQLSAQTSNFERLWITGRTGSGLKSGVPL